jgi:predicted secreted protein
MNITGAIVLYSITWFMVLFCVLPIRMTSQEEAGEVVPGTPRSAPANLRMGRKMWITTLVATPIWAAIAAVILWGDIGVQDLDVFGMMPERPTTN